MNIKDTAGVENKNWRRGFFAIMGGQTVSLIGSSAVQFALIWWLATETASPLVMALVGLLAFLPQFFLGPFAGVWIDRLPRKKVIIAADLFMGIVAAIFAMSFFIFDLPYWVACVVVGVRAIGGVFHLPAMQAAIPLLVPKDELVRVNGWSQFLQSGAFMIGPVLGAAMFAVWPLPVILLSDLVGALVAVLAIAFVKIPEIAAPPQEKHFLNEMKEGVKVYLRDKRLWIVTLVATICMVFFLPLAVFYPLMSSSYFKVTAWHASLIEFLYALGMMFGAALMAKFGTIKDKLVAAQIGLFVMGVTALLSGLLSANMAGFWIFAGLCLTMGASGIIFNIPFTAYLQETVPAQAQGRAFSFLGSLMSVTMPIGLAAAGPAAELFGVSFWFLASGAAIIAITGAGILITLKQYRFEKQYGS